jgi:hypothetical protein
VVAVEGSTFSYLSSSPEEQKAFDVAVHECAYALGYE